jgi:hypothetical protein
LQKPGNLIKMGKRKTRKGEQKIETGEQERGLATGEQECVN